MTIRMKKILIALTIIFCATTGIHAQDQSTLSVLSLNVDGLPGQIYFFNVNQDGPKSAGSERISEYLRTKDCDILCLQEDFNYRWEIWSQLFAGYNHDEWSGGIITEEANIDFAHLQNLKFPCDGLNMVWKKDHQSTNYQRVAWDKSFGKFSHDFDDMVTKGFRRHEITLANGHKVVVYNMHMDASSDRDEQKNNDAKDKEARLSQWIQLRQDILDNLDTRPVIIAGDMNSFYHRDPIKTEFIDVINATGKAEVKDAWIEKCNDGIYPDLGSTILSDETLDKILYVNPTDGDIIHPIIVVLDTEGYTYKGKPMGDHSPLIATFEFEKATGIRATQIDHEQMQNDDSPIYNIAGQRVSNNYKGVVIQNGSKRIK